MNDPRTKPSFEVGGLNAYFALRYVTDVNVNVMNKHLYFR